MSPVRFWVGQILWTMSVWFVLVTLVSAVAACMEIKRSGATGDWAQISIITLLGSVLTVLLTWAICRERPLI